MAYPSSDRETGNFRSDDTTTSQTVSNTTSSDVTSSLVHSYLSLNVTVIDASDVTRGTLLPTASPSPSPSINDVSWDGYSLIDQLPGYSPWVGIRTAVVLGTILALFVAYLCIKTHFTGRWSKRHSIHSLQTSSIRGARMSATDKSNLDVIDSNCDVIDIHHVLAPERLDDIV